MSKKFIKYFAGRSVPESYFPEGSKAEKLLMPWITVAAIFFFIFLVTFKWAQVGDVFFSYIPLALVYIPIGILALIFNILELVEEKTPWGDSSTLTGDYKLWQVALIGIGIGLFFVYPNFIGSFVGVQLFSLRTLAAGTLGSLMITGILIPVIENAFFAKFMVPSMFELGGRFKLAGPIGILVPSLIFGLVHAGAYGVLSASFPFGILLAVIWPIIFRMVTAASILETKSYLPAVLPHIILNSVLVLM